jgi:hypothetical protein
MVFSSESLTSIVDGFKLVPPSLGLLLRCTLGLQVIIIQLEIARGYDFQLAMNYLTHLFVGL